MVENLKQRLRELLKDDVRFVEPSQELIPLQPELPLARILPLVNYQSEDKKSFQLDRGIYSILAVAVRAAQWFTL